MRTIIKLIYILAFLITGTFVACNEKMGAPDKRLTEVEHLFEPVNDKSIVLESSASAAVYFEWEYTNHEKSGTLLYQIAFDKQDGDFSDPVYIMFSDNNGFHNHISISHKKLNSIAALAGIKSAETGTLKWTVFTLKGTESLKANQENSITVTRLAGFEEIPIDMYVTGEASEGKNALSNAHKMKAIAGGEFEVYTKLESGKPFYFVDATKGNPNKYFTENQLIKENGFSTVDKDGVYKITLDFNTGAATYSLVEKIGFFFSPENKLLFDLPYTGNGVFKATKQTVTFKQEGWGRDERYKFRMYIIENEGKGGEKELEWGTLNQTDSRPTASSPESYYFLQLVTPSRWDNKWKLMDIFDGVPADYTIYLQADKPYTHSITK